MCFMTDSMFSLSSECVNERAALFSDGVNFCNTDFAVCLSASLSLSA